MTESDMQIVPIDDVRGKVSAMEKAMLSMPQVIMEPVHHFADGLYARELFIPAGTIIVGKVHKRDHLNFLVKGDITVITDQGRKRMTAPCIIKSVAGVKRVGLTHEDTIWVTVHAIEAEEGCDIETLENELTVPTMDDYDEYMHSLLVEEVVL